MESSLEHLVQEGVLTEVVGRLKSGKEADVYVVRYGGEVVAAKVYKDRAQRSFKNNAVYKEGRSVRNSRSQRAMDSGSKFGKAAEEDAWKAAEAATLYKLHAAGVRVPTPVMFLEGVLLMELVLGGDGEPAPRLIDMDLTPEEANAAYLDMLSQLVRILSCDLIHGDLSPYNVLWGETGPTIIDFPQIVSASANSNSENFFLRDARNILGHFVAIDPRLGERHGDAREIWRAYVRRELTADFMPSGRPAPAPQRPRVQESPRGDRGPRESEHGRGNQARPAPSGQQDRNRRPPHPDNRPRGGQTPNDNRSRGPQRPNDNRPRGGQSPNDNRSRGPESYAGNRPRGGQSPNDRPRGGQGPNDSRPRGGQGPNDSRPRGGQGPNDNRPRGGQHSNDNRPRGPENHAGNRPRGGQGPNDNRPRGGQGPNDRPRGGQGPNDARPRGPQQQGDPRARGQHGQSDRGLRVPNGNAGNRPARGEHFRGPGGPRRPAPEVIVMTRRSTSDGPVGRPAEPVSPPDRPNSERTGRPRPRGRS